MSKERPVIIITGANGLVGSELVNFFSAKQWHVLAFVRKPDAFREREYVTYVAYDMLGDVPNDPFKNADYFVHCAYIKQDAQHPDALRLNLEATKKLLEASRRHKLKRNVFMSSMSASEDAISSYGKQKFAAEKMFSTSSDTIIRSGLVIGNGGLIRQIVYFMRTKHVVPLIDGGEQPLQVIAAYDLAQVICNIIQKDIAGLLTIAGSEVYTYRELYLITRQKLHITAFLLTVPFWIPLLAIRLINLVHLPLGVTEDNLWGLKKLQAFETLPDLQKLGVTPDPLGIILDHVRID